MRAFAAALLAGPEWAEGRRGGGRSVLLCLPLVLLCLVIVAGGLAGLVASARMAGLADVGQAALAAGCATLVCLALAIPPAIAGAGAAWLLPLWLAPSIGVVGWALLPLPGNGFAERVAGAACLSLPLMVVALSGWWARLPPGLMTAAASCGAPPFARFRMRVAAAFPGIVWACLVVFVLCLGLGASFLAP